MKLTKTDNEHLLSLPERFTADDSKKATVLLQEALGRNEISKLVVDFAKTNFIDSFGIGCLVSVAKALRAKDCAFHIVNLQGDILELFQDTGLDQVFDLDHDGHFESEPVSVDIKLEMSEDAIGNVYAFTLAGIMNHPSGSDYFRERFLLALAEHKKILVDFSDLTFFDSMSIGVMLNMSKLAKETGVEIRLCGANMLISDLFAALSVDKVISSYNTREEALENW